LRGSFLRVEVVTREALDDMLRRTYGDNAELAQCVVEAMTPRKETAQPSPRGSYKRRVQK